MDEINPATTVVFVGRTIKAGLSVSDFHSGVEPEVALEAFGHQLSPERISQLRNASSEEELYDALNSLITSRRGQPVEFEVTEVFLGELPQKVDIYTGLGGGDCGFRFDEGESYLIEAHRDEGGNWQAWLCSSRVSHVEWATEDLRTLRAWREGKPLPPRIYGRVEDWTSRKDSHPKSYPPAYGFRLKLLGGSEPLETVTDSNGRFQFDSLEPGNYRLELNESGWSQRRASGGLQEIELDSGGCAVLFVTVQENEGASRGRIRRRPHSDHGRGQENTPAQSNGSAETAR